ncbi:unnamed protein product [Phytophthora fragariaefolia]|uniref:Unnamed protein product n=1 Tax=Phytophthora fragariaefolia TaxID=1490495 RepID=A0A9W6TPB5_9STRA|nr:unnamed protein product [Phytophthora fragariaefolia]
MVSGFVAFAQSIRVHLDTTKTTAFGSVKGMFIVSKSTVSATRSRGFRKFVKRLIDLGCSVQLAHYGGKYSLERMLALEEYTRTTSMKRVLLVILGVPLLATGLVLCQESIPLQDPASGWMSNYGFWIRAGLVGVGVGNAAAIQIGFWFDVPPLSLRQILVYCGLMSVGYIGGGMVIAMLWVFPIPFFMSTLCLVTWFVIVLYIRLVVGPNAFRLLLSRREQLRQLNRVGTVQSLMFIVYPIYQILFTEVSSTHYQLPVLLLLPVIRIVLKYIFASAAAHKEDKIPAQVVFTVDFFDSFYFATFIQSVSSWTLAGIMIVDLIQTVAEMYELHLRAKTIMNQIFQSGAINNDSSLLVVVRALCSRPVPIRIHLDSKIQVRSCIYHQLSEEAKLLIEAVEHSSRITSFSSYQHNLKRLRSRGDLIDSCNISTMSFNATVLPLQSTSALLKFPTKHDIPTGALQKVKSRKQSAINTSDVLKESLEVLFTSECLIVSDAQFHTDLSGLTPTSTTEAISRVFGYALLEFASFVLLVLIKKRLCGISALYQLAFVLETQMLFVQSTLMLWILMTLTYRIVHFGTFSLIHIFNGRAS